MANEKEKSCLARRRLLNLKAGASEKLTQMAGEFGEAGFLSDAVDFYAKAEDAEGLENLQGRVIEEGDLFLLKRIKKCLNRQIEPTELEDLYKNAERLGKMSFAAQAKALLHGGDTPAGGE